MKKTLLFSAMVFVGINFAAAQTNTFPTTGNVGIGTLSPASNLQVIGTTRLGSTNNYATVDANGNLSFNGASAQYRVGGNRYAFAFSGNTNYGLYFNQTNVRFEFRNGNAQSVFTINANGPDITLPIANGNLDSNSTVRWINSNAGANDWQFEHYRSAPAGDNGTLYISHSSSDFSTPETLAALYDTSDFKYWVLGNVVAVDYYLLSDAKLKRDIKDLGSALSIVNQLKPKTYYFNNEKYNALSLGKNMRYGFLAQDVEKVMPELVGNSKKPVRVDGNGIKQYEDVKTVDYVELIPILTKAIQEQQAEINELKATIANMNKGTSASQESSVVIGGNAITLDQNIPNPLKKTTTIRYNIPATANNAQLIITDMNGKVIKQMPLSKGQGSINVDASALSNGTYNYSLVVDGKKIETKRMVVAD